MNITNQEETYKTVFRWL